MADPSPAGGLPASDAKASLEAANPAATSAPERTNSRRDKLFCICIASPHWNRPLLDMRFPPFFIFAPPHLHRFRITLYPPVFRVEIQLTVHFPSDVRELQHCNGDVSHGNRGVQLLAIPDSRDEVSEMPICHGIGPQQVSRR